MIPSADILAILIYILAIFVIYHSYKSRGAFKTVLLLLGFLVSGGCIENVNIIVGGYYYPPSPLTFFIYRCPLWVWLGWYLIAYCGVFIAHSIIGNGRGSLQIVGIGTELENGIDKKFILHTIMRSAFAAYISMLIGLVMDPVAAANGWWIWRVDNIYIHGVPFGNYIGWCLVVFWTLFFYDLIIAWSSTEGKKESTTVIYWSIASVAALLLAGLALMGTTFAFGMDGIRTDNRTPLMEMVLNVNWGEIMIAGIMVLIAVGLILATQFIPNRMPKPQPMEKTMYILPPIILLIYWAVMIVTAAYTSSLLVATGILNCIPLFLICNYYLRKSYQK